MPWNNTVPEKVVVYHQHTTKTITLYVENSHTDSHKLAKSKVADGEKESKNGKHTTHLTTGQSGK